jgi:hypothetical protein
VGLAPREGPKQPYASGAACREKSDEVGQGSMGTL